MFNSIPDIPAFWGPENAIMKDIINGLIIIEMKKIPAPAIYCALPYKSGMSLSLNPPTVPPLPSLFSRVSAVTALIALPCANSL